MGVFSLELWLRTLTSRPLGNFPLIVPSASVILFCTFNVSKSDLASSNVPFLSYCFVLPVVLEPGVAPLIMLSSRLLVVSTGEVLLATSLGL